MSKVTDRLENQNIVNLARQQYESKQKSKLPSVVVRLASNGNVYPKNHPLRNGTIEMRYMTAYDEDILTNASYIREGIVFKKLLESIILTEVSIDEIATVDQFGLIITARILAYGPDYDVTVTDPRTKKQLKRTINLKTLKNKPFDLVCDDDGEFTYEVNSDCFIKFKFPYTEQEYDTISGYLKSIIVQVNETRIPAEIENFIRYSFLSIDAKKFRQYVNDNSPGLDFNIEIEGEDGSTFPATFPVGPELFWF